jgi:hypothetical protein
LLLVFAACDSADTSQRAETNRAEGTCTATSVRKGVHDFYRDLSEGQIGDAMAQVAPRADFEWYDVGTDGSPGNRLPRAAMERATLSGYLARRASADETWSLRSLTFNGRRASDNTGHFQMTLLRTAADIEGQQTFRGKGALDCSSGRIMVISIEQVR